MFSIVAAPVSISTNSEGEFPTGVLLRCDSACEPLSTMKYKLSQIMMMTFGFFIFLTRIKLTNGYADKCKEGRPFIETIVRRVPG